jgi:Recombination endonuclease VII
MISRTEYMRGYRERNREKVRAINLKADRKRREADPEGVAAYQREYRERNNERLKHYDKGRWGDRYDPRRRRDYHLRKTYDVTLDQYEAQLVDQGGGCAICGRSPGGGGQYDLGLDHCHETNMNRGILCRECNAAEGHARSSPIRLRALAAYIEFWSLIHAGY